MGRASRIKQATASAKTAPNSGDPLFERALDALRSGNHGAAIVTLRQVLLERPGHPQASFHLATSLREQSQIAEAIALFETLLEAHPRNVPLMVHFAETLRRAKRFADAERLCCEVIAIEPDHSEAHVVRGATRQDWGRWSDAIADYEKAIVLDPRAPLPHKRLVEANLATGRRQEAMAAFRIAERDNLCDFELYRLAGDNFDRLGQTSDSFSAYRKAMDLNPYDIHTYINLCALLCKTELIEVALSVADVGIKLEPDTYSLHFNRAVALERLNRSGDAAHAYADALRCDPQSGNALIAMCRLRSQVCDWDGLEVSRALARTMTYKKGAKTPPFGILPLTPSLAEVYNANRLWARSFVVDQPPLATYAPRPVERRSERLRIGYLSADFHQHATAALIAEVFEFHDRGRFETFGFSIGAKDHGPMRQRLVAALDHFHDIADFSFDAAAGAIRRTDIDILIDLKGYTFQARPEILARRPAPIQVNYLGYPSTMGARFIDYIVGDAVVTPMEHAPYYTEQIVQLPHSYQPNDRKRLVSPDRPTRANCGLPATGFVFCCFNACYKITPAIFSIWMRLLAEAPHSVLWLYASDPSVPDNLRREAVARGIDPGRLVFATPLPMSDHLARIGLADLFLDTLPVGAHTTASDALWVGLPVLTCCGEGFAARVSASLVRAVGLPELATASLEDYERTALELYRNPATLMAIRGRLVENLPAAPLFDSLRYTRDLERALLRMSEIRDQGLPPQPFAIVE